MKQRHLFGRGVVLIIILGCLFLTGRWLFFSVIHHNTVIDGLSGLKQQITEDIEKGKTSEIYYIKNITEQEIYQINNYVDSPCGDVDYYKIIIESGQYAAVQFEFNLSENYYVIRKFTENIDIPEDNTRAKEIYQVMKNFYDTYITEDMWDYEKELAAHDFLVERSIYGYPENQEDAYTAYGLLVEQNAVCDGYAQSFAMLCQCMDISCVVVVGTADDSLHAWNQVQLDGSWYNVDVTWDDSLPDMGNRIRHSYFNVDDEVLSYDHDWQQEYYYTCSANEYNYYIKNGTYYNSMEELLFGLPAHTNGLLVVEAVVVDFDSDSFDLSFLFDTNSLRSMKYAVCDMGKYTNIIIYTNM